MKVMIKAFSNLEIFLVLTTVVKAAFLNFQVIYTVFEKLLVED